MAVGYSSFPFGFTLLNGKKKLTTFGSAERMNLLLVSSLLCAQVFELLTSRSVFAIAIFPAGGLLIKQMFS